jgi:hypothetical protein
MSLLNAGYMVFDGARAFLVGDYLRFKSGSHAGQLGPWSGLAESVGIDPMSPLMKMIFVIVGLYGLLALGAFTTNKPNGWLMLLLFCVFSSWNLMFGTMSSLIVALLLVLYKFSRD